MIKAQWDPNDYAHNNWPQEWAAREILKESEINLRGMLISDVGCGPGNISAEMAGVASYVLGIDASPDMIKKAQATYGDMPNIKFDCIAAEKFYLESKFDIVTSFFCLHWIKDKRIVFNNFYNLLKPGGNILCTVSTTEEKTAIMEVIFLHMMQLKARYPALTSKTISELTGRYGVAMRDLHNMLSQSGFHTLNIKPKVLSFTFKSLQDFTNWQRPGFMSTPLARLVPEEDLVELRADFVRTIWEKLEENPDGSRTYRPITTVVTAHKA